MGEGEIDVLEVGEEFGVQGRWDWMVEIGGVRYVSLLEEGVDFWEIV